jgi:hypothetical protein
MRKMNMADQKAQQYQEDQQAIMKSNLEIRTSNINAIRERHGGI